MSYFYVQMFGERSGAWHVIGDQYRSLNDAEVQLERYSMSNPNAQLRIVVYPESAGPLNPENAEDRLTN